MRHEFHPEAVLEFEEAVQFYKERGRKLGQRFAREIRATIVKIVTTPERWRVLEQDVHLCRTRETPPRLLAASAHNALKFAAVRDAVVRMIQKG
jgi:toxin ParE1/3/4